MDSRYCIFESFPISSTRPEASLGDVLEAGLIFSNAWCCASSFLAHEEESQRLAVAPGDAPPGCKASRPSRKRRKEPGCGSKDNYPLIVRGRETPRTSVVSKNPSERGTRFVESSVTCVRGVLVPRARAICSDERRGPAPVICLCLF
jgi:hypothetical protein